jgi:hypothetical protein
MRSCLPNRFRGHLLNNSRTPCNVGSTVSSEFGGEGWMQIMAKLCTKLEPIVTEDFKITVVKAKFGSLRIAYRGGNQAIDDVIEEAKAEGRRICEVCGAADMQRERAGREHDA